MTLLVSKNLKGLTTLNDKDIKKVGKLDRENVINIGILNLMPTKIETESQFLSLLSNCEANIKVDFIRLNSIDEKNSYYDYIVENYYTFDEIKDKIDAIIVTGAPLEKIDFSEVNYINELQYILNYIKTTKKSILSICWGAQATLNYFYKIDKVVEDKKIFGIFNHEILKEDQLFKGVENGFKAPHSRHTSLCSYDIAKSKELKVLAITEEGYDHILRGKFNDYYILGHCEYGIDTLDIEYKRDLKKGLDINMPQNYYHDNDSEKGINYSWLADSIKLYNNWVNSIN